MRFVDWFLGRKEKENQAAVRTGTNQITTVLYKYHAPTAPKFKVGDVVTGEGYDRYGMPLSNEGVVLSMEWRDYSDKSYWLYEVSIKGYKHLSMHFEEKRCWSNSGTNSPSNS